MQIYKIMISRNFRCEISESRDSKPIVIYDARFSNLEIFFHPRDSLIS